MILAVLMIGIFVATAVVLMLAWSGDPAGRAAANKARSAQYIAASGINIEVDWRKSQLDFPPERSTCDGVNWPIRIEYCDAHGEFSERTVTVNSVEFRHGIPWRLDGLCHRRRAERSFVISGIISLIDIATGEAVEDIDLWIADQLIDHDELD